MLTEHRYESFAVLQRALIDWSQQLLQRALAHQQQVSVLLSGGSTPLPYYCALSHSGLRWDDIKLALVDERWVDSADAASNERAIKAAFADNEQALRNFTAMKNAAKSAAEGTEECNARYAQLPWPPTLCVLGLGADGHTASLFPAAQGLQEALNIAQFCAPIEAQPSRVTGNHTGRMTLTLWALLQAQHIALVFSGEQKWQVYLQARRQEDLQLPVSLVLQRAGSVDVFWSAE